MEVNIMCDNLLVLLTSLSHKLQHRLLIPRVTHSFSFFFTFVHSSDFA